MIGKTNAQIGATLKGEKLNISLTSNQSDASDLIGATITVTYAGESSEYTWNGSQITVEVPAYVEYSVAYSTVSGYSTPSAFTSTAVEGNSRTLSAQYQTTILTVLMADNQDNYNDISSATATVTATGISSTTVSSGGTVKVPTGVTDCKIIWSSITNYKTPTLDAFTTSGTAMSKTGTYQTEVVTVTVTANAGGSVTGQTVTINGVTTTLTSTGTVTQKVAFGTSYQVSINDKTNYNKTSAQTFTANSQSRSVTMAYTIKTETLTVNVTGLSSGFSVDVTIGSTSNVQTATSATYTVNYGTSYTITPTAVSGYDVSPTTFTRTAASSTYSHTVTYTAQRPSNGIYVATSSGEYISPSSFNSSTHTAVGVAVITDNSAFIIGRTSQQKTAIAWSSNTSTNLTDVPTSTASSTIATYYDGVSYTDAMIAAGSEYNTTDYAAGYARSCTITIGSTIYRGYLGSAGEWQDALNNHDDIVIAFTAIGETFVPSYFYFWTSCEYSSSGAWYAYWNEFSSYWDLSYYSKSLSASSFCVVPFYKIQ